MRDELLPNVAYDFRVRTICSPIDTSAFSNIITFQVPKDIGPSASRFCLEADIEEFKPNDIIELKVNARDINQSLVGASFQITYPSNWVNFLDASKTNFIPATNQQISFDERKGTVNIELLGSTPSVGAMGTVYILRFQVKSFLPISQDLVFTIGQATAITLSRQTIALENCPGLLLKAISPCPTAKISAIGPSSFCEGQTTTLQTTLGNNFSYRWFKDGELLPGETQAFLQVSKSGNYTAQIESPGCLLAVSEPFSITVYPLPDLGFSIFHPTLANANDGKISINVFRGKPPYTYTLNNLFLQDQEASYEFNRLSAGNYTLTVLDGNGCQVTRRFILESRIRCPEAFLLPQGNIAMCENQRVQLVTNRGAEYIYRWFRNNAFFIQTSENILITQLPGTYKVEIQAPGCSTSTSQAVNLVLQNNLSLDIQAVAATAIGATDGKIRVTASGGKAPYTYVLNSHRRLVATGPVEFEGLGIGDYILSVEDELGCRREEHLTLSVSSSATSELCVSPGAVRHVVNNSNNRVTFFWQENQNTQCVVLLLGSSLNSRSQWRTFLIPKGRQSFVVDNLSSGTYFYELVSNCALCSPISGVFSSPSQLQVFTIGGGNKNKFDSREIGSQDAWRVYPNPTSGIFSLETFNSAALPAHITVTDLSGKVLFSQVADEPLQTFALHQKGVYLLKVQSQSYQQVIKIAVH
ncbi:MAG: T9SS type A sorting domain-containing protein [Bacteroidia bacterium]|nr:T9SS type A sorting domain-containing protein [Bacteroidia bacterium]